MKPQTSAGGQRNGSQDSLAHAIAREVQARLPAPESGSGLTRSVRHALHEEACSIELTLAYLRAAGLAVASAVGIAGVVYPSAVNATIPVPVAVSAAVALVAACAFAAALHRGWYQPLFRRVVPVADAALLLVLVLLFARAPAAHETVRIGVGAAVAAACAFLVLSGSARLSLTSQRVATTLAVGVWLVAGFVLEMPLAIALAIAAFLVALGLLGTRFASIVRGLVATQVHGDRLGGLYDKARTAIEAREEVLRIVAHDLRNPLSTISMTAELLRDQASDETTRGRLAIIGRASSSMNRLIHDLLDAARLEAGRMSVEPRAVPARELLDRAQEMMTPIAAAQKVELRVLAPDELPDVLVDDNRILQVLSNLSGNAVKFTPQGGSVTLKAERVLETVRFSVRDTGPGIPPERAARIFERFWQADPSDRRGIGLGLAIARSIIEAHGQRIGVDSPPSGGSEFWFTVRVADGDERAPAGGT